jgi:hypothetical protein
MGKIELGWEKARVCVEEWSNSSGGSGCWEEITAQVTASAPGRGCAGSIKPIRLNVLRARPRRSFLAGAPAVRRQCAIIAGAMAKWCAGTTCHRRMSNVVRRHHLPPPIGFFPSSVARSLISHFTCTQWRAQKFVEAWTRDKTI